MSGDNSPYDPSATPTFGDVPAGGVPANGTPAVPPAPGATPGRPGTAAAAAMAGAATAALSPLPPENVLRGFLLSLIALPAGVLVFTFIFNLGFIASIVGFGVAFAAYFLYRLGSGGRVSMRGALIVTAVTIGTLLIAFFVGEISSIATELAQYQGRTWGDVVSTPGFPSIAMGILTNPANLGNFIKDFALTMVFGLLGCFALLRGAFREARAASAPPTVQFPPISPPPPSA